MEVHAGGVTELGINYVEFKYITEIKYMNMERNYHIAYMHITVDINIDIHSMLPNTVQYFINCHQWFHSRS